MEMDFGPGNLPCLCFLNSITSSQQISHGFNNHFRHQRFHDNLGIMPDLPDDLPINRNIVNAHGTGPSGLTGLRRKLKAEWRITIW
jgi:hypothetical protein